MMALDHGKSLLKVFNQPEGPRTIEFNSDETISPNKHLYGIWSSEQEAKVVFVGIESSNKNHQLVIGDELVVDSISYKFMYGILNSTTMDTVLYCAIQGGGKVELAAGELDSTDKQVRVQRNPDNGLNWLLKLFSKFPFSDAFSWPNTLSFHNAAPELTTVHHVATEDASSVGSVASMTCIGQVNDCDDLGKDVEVVDSSAGATHFHVEISDPKVPATSTHSDVSNKNKGNRRLKESPLREKTASFARQEAVEALKAKKQEEEEASRKRRGVVDVAEVTLKQIV
jgi:hypothetical protein